MSSAMLQIRDVVEAISPAPRGGFTWFGQRQATLSGAVWSGLGPPARRRYTSMSVANHLYRYFYCPGEAIPVPFRDIAGRGAGDIAPAVAGIGTRWDNGWTVVALAGEHARITRHELTLTVSLSEFRAEGGIRPSVGSVGAVKMSRVLPRVAPGFVLSIGARDPDLPTSSGRT